VSARLAVLVTLFVAGCSTTASPPSAEPNGELIAVDWLLTSIRRSNAGDARPADPLRYQLRLEPDGTLQVRADCNRAGGRYRKDGNTIAIEVTHSTMAACEPGSLAPEFQRDLGSAATYSVRNGKLNIELKDCAGTMEFQRK
jgi:heat shock protein HslJ